MRLLYLKQILEEPEESNILKMFKLQLEMPTRGDWASTCLSDLKFLNLKLNLEEKRTMPKTKYCKKG